MTQPLITIAILAALAAVFLLHQHGFGNTLLSIGMWFYDAGTAFNSRAERRRKLVVQRWMERLEAAE